MKKLIILCAIILTGCDEPIKKDLNSERIKDSIDRLIKCNECQQKAIIKGADPNAAKDFCEKIYKVK